MGRARRIAGRLALAGAGAVLAQATLRALMASPAGPGLDRTNHRGRTLSLASGPALAVAAATTAAVGAASAPVAVAALTAGLGAGAVGLYDDMAGVDADQKATKGFRGHLSALRQGRVTSGMVKIGGIGVAGLAASVLLSRGTGPGRGVGPRRSRLGGAAHVLLGAGVIAGMANLVNLFDLRPGRALKVGLLVGAPLAVGPAAGLVAGPLGAAGVLLPDDLDERVMLGDSGANALGAILGLAIAARSGPLTRGVLLAGIAGLTLASERISFTKVIARTPALNAVDMWGRRPVGDVPPVDPVVGESALVDDAASLTGDLIVAVGTTARTEPADPIAASEPVDAATGPDVVGAAPKQARGAAKRTRAAKAGAAGARRTADGSASDAEHSGV